MLSNINFTLSWRRTLSYRNQFTDFKGMLCKSMNWFLYDWDFHDEIGVNDIKVRWLERRQIKHKTFWLKIRDRSWCYCDKIFSISGIKKSNKVFIIILAIYSSYLTSCDIQSVYYRVSNKRSPRLLIFDFFPPMTLYSQFPRSLIFQVQNFNNMKHFSHAFVCQICKKCRSFNLTLLTNKSLQ